MKKKRIIAIILALFVFVTSVTVPYYETKAFDIPTAFWGTLEASRAFWTALNAGGGVRGGGVSISAFERSSREDMQNLQSLVMKGYLHYLFFRKKIEIQTNNPSLSNEEVESQAQSEAQNSKTRFENSAINVNNTTNGLTRRDYGYWRDYCDKIDYIAKNGLEVGSGSNDITPNTVFTPEVYNYSNVTAGQKLSNIGSNCIEYDGNYYIQSGVRYDYWANSQTTFDVGNVPTDRIRLIATTVYPVNDNVMKYGYVTIDINKLAGTIIQITNYPATWFYGGTSNQTQQKILSLCANDNFVTYMGNTDNGNEDFVAFCNDWRNTFSITGGGNGQTVEQYEISIKDALDNTEAGKAIKQGAVNGREAIIDAQSIPVKRTGIIAGEETATGVIGWDIPDARTLEGAIAVPQSEDDVIEGMGIISVPTEAITGVSAGDDVVTWPITEAVTIPKTEPIAVPITEVISEQAGEFYPTQIDLTDFFPFCIPFDIAYCISKFHTPEGSAPVLHIPIMIPQKLQGSLGQSYDVIIDFNNYVALRNIIRYFILLFFVIGLMNVTRGLIRG